MKIFKINLNKMIDVIIDEIENEVFEGGSMHQSFCINSKENIKKSLHMNFENILEEYDIIELSLPDKANKVKVSVH